MIASQIRTSDKERADGFAGLAPEFAVGVFSAYDRPCSLGRSVYAPGTPRPSSGHSWSRRPEQTSYGLSHPGLGGFCPSGAYLLSLMKLMVEP